MSTKLIDTNIYRNNKNIQLEDLHINMVKFQTLSQYYPMAWIPQQLLKKIMDWRS